MASSLVPGTRMAGVLDAIGAAQQDKNRRQLEAAIAGGRLAVQETQNLAYENRMSDRDERLVMDSYLAAREDAIEEMKSNAEYQPGTPEYERRVREIENQLKRSYGIGPTRRPDIRASGGLIRGTVG